MTYDELRVQKNKDASEAHIQARNRFADNGPQLENGERIIMIPSPVYNEKLLAFIKRYGFRYFGGKRPGYTRYVNRPHKGHRYDPAVWLRWAQWVYREAYPMWKGPQ